MSAIDQNLPPVVARQDTGQGRQGVGGSKSGEGDAKPFKDVYDRSGSDGSKGNASSASERQSETAASKEANAGSDKSGDSSSKAAGTVAKYALDGQKAKGQGQSNGKNAAADANQNDAALAEAVNMEAKQQADALAAKKAAANVANSNAKAANQAQAAEGTTTLEADAMTTLLQLLGANTSKANAGSAKAQGADHADKAKDDGKGKDKDSASGDAKSAKDAHGTDMAKQMAQAVAASQGANSDTKDQQSSRKNGDETVYRLSRKDGSGQLDMKLGDGKDGSSALDAKSQGKQKIEHITVLESRRFIAADGGALSANTKAALSAMTGDKDWAAAMKAASAASSDMAASNKPATPLNTLKIQMQPADLGTVTATLRLKGDQLTVLMNVNSGEAYKQLSADKDSLIHSLKSQGFSVDNVNIQWNAAVTPDKGVAQASASQQQMGQQMGQGQDSAAGQFAQQQQQNNNRRQQSNGFSGRQDDKPVGVDAVVDSVDSSRAAGQVYL